MKFLTRLAPLGLLFTSACSDVETPDGCHDHDGELHCDENHGLATTLILNFTPVGGGDTLTFQWADPDNDGNPEVDPILLPDASDHDHHDAQEYTLDVEVWNELEDPAENVTLEIADLSDSHQFFFTGRAVEGPATADNSNAIIQHSYADEDENGLPIGLSNTITTLDWGTADLTVTLRHMPAENGEAVKTAGLADEVADNGFGGIGGGNDIEVSFTVEVE
ncbi:MAG: hypothetical protein ACJAZO_004706 [Myxococcota bacterium]|jgi:hypothetical protein